MNAGISAVLLAAGASARFGDNKLLYPLGGGTPMAIVAARKLIRAVPDCIAVVRKLDILSELLEDEGFSVLVNPHAEDGMAGSVICGINAAPDANGWIIALADMPFISQHTIRMIADSLNAGAAITAPVYEGRRGHPVGFANTFKSQLLQLKGDQGARDILATYSSKLITINVDDGGVLQDIDRLGDLTDYP